MAKSRIGLDFDAALDDDGPVEGGAADWSDGDVDGVAEEEEEDAAGGGDDDDDDSDDGLFTADALQSVRGPPGGGGGLEPPVVDTLGISAGRSVLAQAAITGFDMGGFLVGGSDARDLTRGDASPRPALENLPVSAFTPGTEVWIADPNDVVTVMRTNWEPAMEEVCAGRARGTVLRVSGDNVVIDFGEQAGVQRIFTFARACLFKRAISPYDVAFDASTSKRISGGAGLGPRAGHDKKVPEPVYGLLAPLARASTIGSPCKTTQAVLDALQASNSDLAEESIASFCSEYRKTMGVDPDIPSPQPEDDTALDASVTRGNRALIAMAQGNVEVADELCDTPRAMQSDSITLCLRAWHVKLLVGNFSAALDLLNHVDLLCPHEPIVDMFRRITHTFRSFDSAARSLNIPLAFASSYRLERRALARRYFVPGDVIATDEVLFSMPQQESSLNAVCAWSGKRNPTYSDPRAPQFRFMDKECFDKAWASFLEFEELTSEFSVRSARYLLESRRGSEHFKDEEGPLLESAHMAIRVWSRLVSAARRAVDRSTAKPVNGASIDVDSVVYQELERLGLAPIPDGIVFRCVSTKVEYQLKCIHAVLSGRMPAEQKEFFDLAFFRNIVIAVHTYRKNLLWPLDPSDSETSHVALSVVTRFSGSVPCYDKTPADADAVLHVGDNDEVLLIAQAVIDPRQELRVL